MQQYTKTKIMSKPNLVPKMLILIEMIYQALYLDEDPKNIFVQVKIVKLKKGIV